MNGQDKKDLNVILERMDRADEDRKAIRQDIKFIKENLFDPHKGLWAETRLNTQFRIYKQMERCYWNRLCRSMYETDVGHSQLVPPPIS